MVHPARLFQYAMLETYADPLEVGLAPLLCMRTVFHAALMNAGVVSIESKTKILACEV